jgi:hypothetical protein
VGDQFSYGYLGFGASPDGKSIFYLTGGECLHMHACISHGLPALELNCFHQMESEKAAIRV